MTTDADLIDLWPKEANFRIYQGDDSSFTVTFDDDIDITAIEATLTIQRMDGTNALVLTLGNGIVRSGQVLTTTITKVQAAALPVGVILPYDFATNGTILGEKTVACGVFQVKKQKTS